MLKWSGNWGGGVNFYYFGSLIGGKSFGDE